ncbi:hypothetical protein EWM64_g1862 [Hericium alpestre]|uniref:MalT-like TPR region domain-containing protein n=1 Tax=Hericium alpestre TaxID=135208 RepID=A0A4Z0A563_9AGAM|nr:hypothetical protein EWM64_g1862 [Hericium alpestre]
MTSRSTTLPPDFVAQILPVGNMDEETAFQLFRATYASDVSLDVIVPVLSALNFHPLSISLLAQTARQNQWSPKRVVDSWTQRHVRLLKTEYRSLGETFELSLQSSVIQRHVQALSFLQIIAFLPTGVDENKLQELFPDVPDVHGLVDTLCNHSLVYQAGDFITMLAPIRLYITDAYNRTGIPLLDDVRRYYYKRLQEPMVGDSGAWIAAEDDNIEQIIALDLSIHTRQEIGCNACIHFIQHLIRHKRRPTALDELVGKLPEDDSKYVEFFGLCFPRLFGRNRTTVRKRTCTLTLGLLAAQIGHSAEALTLLLDSKRLFALLDDWDTVCICLELIGQIYILRGQMNAAKKILDEGLKTSKRAEDPQGARFKLIVTLGWVKILEQARDHRRIPDFEEAEAFFMQHNDTAWVTYSLNRRAYAELYRRNFDAARDCLHREHALHTEANNDRGCMGSLMALAEVALAEGVRDLDEANRLLDEARDLALRINDMQKASLALAVKSALSADVKNFSLARSQIEQAKREMTFAEENENFRLVWCIYLSARNEFMAHDYDRAKTLFKETLKWSNTESDTYTAVRSMKALGEIALLQGNTEEARMWGEQADRQSQVSGVASYLHDIKYHCCLMKNSFEGRRLYQDGGLPSPGVLSV